MDLNCRSLSGHDGECFVPPLIGAVEVPVGIQRTRDVPGAPDPDGEDADQDRSRPDALRGPEVLEPGPVATHPHTDKKPRDSQAEDGGHVVVCSDARLANHGHVDPRDGESNPARVQEPSEGAHARAVLQPSRETEAWNDEDQRNQPC